MGSFLFRGGPSATGLPVFYSIGFFFRLLNPPDTSGQRECAQVFEHFMVIQDRICQVRICPKPMLNSVVEDLQPVLDD